MIEAVTALSDAGPSNAALLIPSFLAANSREYWVHDLSPFLIRLSETFGIRYYGLAYLAGFLGAAWLLRLYHRKGRSPVAPGQIADLILAVVLGVLIGGRLGYFLFYEPGTLLRSPLSLLRVWEGGMASHGGFIGVLFAIFWFARSRGLSPPVVGDRLLTTVPFGLMLGRIANFINGELWGRPTNVPWAVIFPQSAPPGTPLELIPPRHPSQLYQAFLEGFLLLAYLQFRFWRNPQVLRRPGQISGEFLVGYAVLRTIGELFREPDASLLLGMTRGTFYSIFLALGGVALIVHSRRAARR